jgi:hypothetical protein
MLPHLGEVSQEELEAYSRPPPPPPNPFIKNLDQSPSPEAEKPALKQISPRRLIKPMLKARTNASVALGAYLRSVENGNDGELVRFLKAKGATIAM